jgi:hypothetical protein
MHTIHMEWTGYNTPNADATVAYLLVLLDLRDLTVEDYVRKRPITSNV